MVEVSEREKARRKARRDQDTHVPAQSFRFGKEIRDKLARVSKRLDRSQADVMRKLIDEEYERVFKKKH